MLVLLMAFTDVKARSTTATLLKVKDKLILYKGDDDLPLTQIELRPFPFISGVNIYV